MTVNPHRTDQILAAYDECALHAGCDADCPFEKAAATIAAELVDDLPRVDPRLIGEIVLHAAEKALTMLNTMDNDDWPWEDIAVGITNSLTEAAVALYRGQRAAAERRP